MCRNGPPPLPSPYPLPQLQISDEAPSDDPPPPTSTRPAPTPDDTSAEDVGKLVLTLHARWRPGMSTTHADLVMATSSSARAAYELYLYKKDRGESSPAKQHRDSTSAPEDAAGDASVDWEDDEDGDGGGGGAADPPGHVDEIENKKDGTRTRKGGTFRWLKHGAKVAKGRIRGIRHHQLSEMAPETELQAAL